jgi:aryl carrier-like protein
MLNPLPFGASGEVCIGGGALARGYINHAEWDNELFVADPFRPGSRMFRTGDRGWLDENGNLHFLGRLDRQVKLRGYRIELGEIEVALMSVEGVSAAAVKILNKDRDKPSLHAWVAMPKGLGADSLQRVLRVRLPDYMIPGGISVLQELPMTGSGKIDYSALPEPSVAFASHEARQPKNDIERQLLELWEAELVVRPLGVQDNFFDVGGDSLAAISILSGLAKISEVSVPLFLLTENPTIEQFARALQQPLAASSSVVRLSSGARRVPLYIAASGYGDLMRFQVLANVLHDTYDVHMLQPPVGRPIESISNLAVIYADQIESQGLPAGYVAGFSVGGITALEIACALQQRLLPIKGLMLIDTLYPRAIWGGTLFWRAFVWLVKKLRLGALMINGRRLDAMVKDSALVGQVTAMAGYRPRAYCGPTLLIKTSGLARWDKLFFTPWRKLQKGYLSEQLISGLHGSIFEPQQVSELASVLRRVVQ